MARRVDPASPCVALLTPTLALTLTPTLQVIEANGYGVNSATLHPERKAFVAAGGNFWVYVHDFETGEELQCNKGHHGPVYGVRFTPGGNTYASGGDDGTIRIWTYANGEAGGDAAADEEGVRQ